MTDPFLLVLRRPLELSAQKWTELTLTEPTLGQVLAAEKVGRGNDMIAQLISEVTKVPLAALKQMSISDFRQADAFFGQFASPGRETGDGE